MHLGKKPRNWIHIQIRTSCERLRFTLQFIFFAYIPFLTPVYIYVEKLTHIPSLCWHLHAHGGVWSPKRNSSTTWYCNRCSITGRYLINISFISTYHWGPRWIWEYPCPCHIQANITFMSMQSGTVKIALKISSERLGDPGPQDGNYCHLSKPQHLQTRHDLFSAHVVKTCCMGSVAWSETVLTKQISSTGLS